MILCICFFLLYVFFDLIITVKRYLKNLGDLSNGEIFFQLSVASHRHLASSHKKSSHSLLRVSRR